MARIQDFDFSVNLLQALLWQYNAAPNIEALIQAKQSWYDQSHQQFWDDWYTNVFNLQTCNDFGCTVWAIILGLPLSLISTPPQTKKTFGFYNTTAHAYYHLNFYKSNFAQSSNSGINLTLQQKRLVLRLRYYQLVARGTIPETNRVLTLLFGGQPGQIYILDGLNMTATLVFNFPLNPALLGIFQKYDLIPRPSGVKLIYVNGTNKVFGFGTPHKNFYKATFTAIH
jgi:hypothetical protein